MIRLAEKNDIQAIADTYTELLLYEQEHGSSSNWQLGVYPTAAVPREKVASRTMYVLEENNKICASMILNNYQPDKYREIDWLYPASDEKVLVIHTLCVPPSSAGKGYGSKMVAFAKDYAASHGCTVVRIDTYAHNEPAKRLYLKNGFRLAGYAEMTLEGLIEEELAFLEIKLG